MKKLVTLFISIVLATNASNLWAQTSSIARKPVAPASLGTATRSNAPRIPTNTTRPTVPIRPKESRFQIGFRAGFNSTTISGVDASAVGTGLQLARVTGFHAGAILNIGGPVFSIQPEILFAQYGVRMKAGSDYLQLKYNLVEVPILAKATFGQPNLRFFVNAGPVVSYTMGGTVSFQDAGQSGSQRIDMTHEGRLSYGVSGGSGIVMKAGPGSVLLEARYTYLFSSNENGAKLNPQNFMVSVGYLIPLRGR